jgi:hypothetical protein
MSWTRMKRKRWFLHLPANFNSSFAVYPANGGALSVTNLYECQVFGNAKDAKKPRACVAKGLNKIQPADNCLNHACLPVGRQARFRLLMMIEFCLEVNSYKLKPHKS